jgi:TP901 family phage tail tape measure protein
VSLENVGLGGVLSFDEKAAVAGMKSAGSAADKFVGQFSAITDVAKSVGSGMGQVAGAVGSFGVAALPATAIIGAGTKVAVDFEKEMSAVGAVSQASATEMAQLTKVAKQQGATTAFSATQAAEGLELLALGGFSAKESIDALPAVLSAAAADGIELSQAADVVSSTLKALDLPATEAGRAADVLAMTSGKTSTSILGLGEAMKYAAPEAHTMGITLETTAGVLGLVADAGLKGSIGGTAFTSALVKLAKPSKQGAEYIQQLGISMTKTADGGLDIIDVFKQIDNKTKGVSDVMQRAAIINEIFGERGSKAFTAMQTAIRSGKADSLVEELKNAKGYAEQMAKTRMDNFAGSIEQLTGAIEGFALETAGRFLGPAKESVDMYADVISNIVLVLQELNTEEGLTGNTADKAGGTLTAIAKGIKEGLDFIIDGWRFLREQVVGFISQFVGGQAPQMLEQFSKIATIMFVVAGAVAPIIVALGGVALFISSVILPAFTAIGGVIGAVFSAPVLAAVAIVIGGFMLIRNEGESVGQTFQRIVDGIVAGFNWVMDTAVNPFIEGFQWVPNVFKFVLEKFDEFAFNMRTIFGDIIGGIIQAAKALAPFFKVLFTFIGNIVGVIVQGIGLAFTTMFDIVTDIMQKVRALVLSVVESIVNFIKNLAWGLGFIADAVGLDWGKKMKEFGEGEFHVQAGVERGLKPEKQVSDSGVSAAEMAELDKQAQNDLLAMQVGKAVGDNMPKEINVESKVCVDGKTIATATAKHKQELADRAGFKATPWQRRAMAEHGAAPVGGA